MDGNEFREGSHPAKAEHGARPSSKRLSRILRPIARPTAGFAIIERTQVFQCRPVRPELVRHEAMLTTMVLHGFPEEFQCSTAIWLLGDVRLQDFAFVSNDMPELVGDADDLHENLVQVPAPARQGQRVKRPLTICSRPLFSMPVMRSMGMILQTQSFDPSEISLFLQCVVALNRDAVNRSREYLTLENTSGDSGTDAD